MRQLRFAKKEDDLRTLNDKGTALIEFALVVPLLLMLLFGIIEFGMMVYNQQVITNASREAARAGIVSASPRKTPSEITSIADNYCNGRLVTFGEANTPGCDIHPIREMEDGTEVEITTGDAEFGDKLKITVSYNYSFLLMPSFMSDLIGGKNLAAQTVMQYE